MLLFQNFLTAEVQQSEQFEERGIWSGRFGLLLPPISLQTGVTSLLWPCGCCVAFWEIRSQSRAPCGMCWQWSHTCDIFHILLKEKICPWKQRCFFCPLCMRLLLETLLLCFSSDNEVRFFYWICFSDLRQEKHNSHHHFLPVFKVNNFGRPCN